MFSLLVPTLNWNSSTHGLVYVKKERWAQGWYLPEDMASGIVSEATINTVWCMEKNEEMLANGPKSQWASKVEIT